MESTLPKQLLKAGGDSHHIIFALIVFFGLFLRVFVAWKFGGGFIWPDEQNDYYPQALRLYEGLGWGEVTIVMPLFPCFMSLIFFITGGDIAFTRMVLAIINSSLIVIGYFLGKKLFNEKVALLTAFIISFYPILIFTSTLMIPEMLFTILICLGVYCFLRIENNSCYIWLSGLLFGLASMAISLTMPFIILSLPVLFFKLSDLQCRRRGFHIAVYLVAFGLILTMWGVRNYFTIGHFLIVKGNLGKVMCLHNHEHASGFDRSGNLQYYKEDILNKNQERFVGKVDIEKDKEYLMLALTFIRNHPKDFIRLCLERFLNLWRFYPNTMTINKFTSGLFKYVSIFTYSPVFIFFLIGFMISRKLWKNQLIIYVYLISLIITFTITRSSMRARLPMEPFLAIYAAKGFLFIRDWVSFKKNNHNIL